MYRDRQVQVNANRVAAHRLLSLTLIAAMLMCGAGELWSQNWLWGVNSLSSPGSNGLRSHGVAHSPHGQPGYFMYNTGEYYGSQQANFGGGPTLPNSAGFTDGYICKHDAAGTVLWANVIQGPLEEAGRKIVVDRYDNSYIVGEFVSSQVIFSSVNGPSMILNNTNAAGTTSDIFIAKYDPDGLLLWVASGGGMSDDRGTDICVDRQTQSTVLITGAYRSSWAAFNSNVLANFDPSGGSEDAFVAKYDVVNGAVLDAWSYGGSDDDLGMSLLSDGTAHIHLAGSFASPVLSSGMLSISGNGGMDMFLMDIDFASGLPNWAVSAGGADDDEGLSLAAAGPFLYVAGVFRDAISFGVPGLAGAGDADGFLVQYNLSGTAQWARAVAGQYGERALCVAAWCNNIYLGGVVESPSVNLGNTVLNNPTSGIAAFLIKYDDAGDDLWSIAPVILTDVSAVEDLVTYWGGGPGLIDFRIGLCGSFSGAVDFGPYWFPGAGGNDDGFVIEIDDGYPFTLSTGGPFCLNNPPVTFTASSGSGTWSGPGIVDPVLGLFDPGVAGIGTHTIVYSLQLGKSCVHSSTAQVSVVTEDWPKHPLPSLAAFARGVEVEGSHINGDGKYFVCGEVLGPGTLDFGGNSLPLTSADSDIFVAMYDDCGAQWSFSTGSPGWKDWGAALKYSQFDDKLYLGGTLGGALPQFNGSAGGLANSTHPALALSTLTSGKTTGFLAQLELDGTVNWISVIDPQSTKNNLVNDIAIDQGSGAVYVVGDFSGSISFPAPGGSHSAPGNTGIFLAKYNVSGQVQWSAAYGIGDLNSGKGVSVYDNGGDVLITGYLGKLPGYAGNHDYFVRRYSAAGALLAGIHKASQFNSFGSDIVADNNNSNQFFVTGAFQDNLDLSTSQVTMTPLSSNGDYDVFTAAYSFANQLQWANSAGGIDKDEGTAIALNDDNVWLCGTLSGAVTLPVAPFTHSTQGGTPDIFVARHKISSGLSGTYTIHDGAGSFDQADDIACNDEGFAYLTGIFDNDLDLNTMLIAAGQRDPFLARLKASGNWQHFFRESGHGEQAQPESTLPLAVDISPQPAGDELRIHIDGTRRGATITVLLLDARGGVIRRSTLQSMGSHTLNMDLRQLAAGSYYLRVTDGQRQVTHSFLRRAD